MRWILFLYLILSIVDSNPDDCYDELGFDPYKILGLSKDITFDKIEQQYRKLAKSYQPELGGDRDLFNKMKKAYKCFTTKFKSASKKDEHTNSDKQYDPYKILGLWNGASMEAIEKRYAELLIEHAPAKGGDIHKYNKIKRSFMKIKEIEEAKEKENQKKEARDEEFRAKDKRKKPKMGNNKNSKAETGYTSISNMDYFKGFINLLLILLVPIVLIFLIFFPSKLVKVITILWKFIFEDIYEDLICEFIEFIVLRKEKDEFVIRKRRLKIDYHCPIGRGITSTVYVGFLRGPSPLMTSIKMIERQRFQNCQVAVKVPLNNEKNETEQQLFREINIMKKIGYNDQVIFMLGVCFMDKKPVIAFELAESSLSSYLCFETTPRRRSVLHKHFYSILWQVASGMQYIASKNIVHRDLAARNILLTKDFNAKISDFGLSICKDDESWSTQQAPEKLPIKWMSPEAIYFHAFSEKSDVWSFGVLMYEVFSFGKVPYENLESTQEHLDYLVSGQRLECPKAAKEEIPEIMSSCWMMSPHARPTFEDLIDCFQDILNRRNIHEGS